MNTGLKALIIIVVILLVLVIASEIAIPIAGSWYLEREIKKRYPEAGSVSVSVRAFPAFRLLFKQYGSLKVEVEGITLKGVNFESIRLTSSRYPDALYEAFISQDEINRFFSIESSYLGDARIAVRNDNIQVIGKFDTGFGVFDVTATGTLSAANGREVYFRPQAVEASGINLPSEIVNQVKDAVGGTPIFLVRQDLPFTISSISAQQGKLKISGDVDLEQALNINIR